MNAGNYGGLEASAERYTKISDFRAFEGHKTGLGSTIMATWQRRRWQEMSNVNFTTSPPCLCWTKRLLRAALATNCQVFIRQIDRIKTLWR